MPPSPVTLPSFTPPAIAFPARTPTPPKSEQGMQAECASLLSKLTKELENVSTYWFVNVKFLIQGEPAPSTCLDCVAENCRA